jgi:hypothetical protein
MLRRIDASGRAGIACQSDVAEGLGQAAVCKQQGAAASWGRQQIRIIQMGEGREGENDRQSDLHNTPHAASS